MCQKSPVRYFPLKSPNKLIKVTVIIRRAGQCADYKTWTGEVDAIHPAFSDGTNQSGVYNSATITALDPKAIQINLKYLNIKITIRQVSKSAFVLWAYLWAILWQKRILSFESHFNVTVFR